MTIELTTRYLHEVQRALCVSALRICQKPASAAKDLGISRHALTRRLQTFDIRVSEWKFPEYSAEGDDSENARGVARLPGLVAVVLESHNLAGASRVVCLSALRDAQSIVDAAKILGITRHSLKRRIIKHRIGTSEWKVEWKVVDRGLLRQAAEQDGQCPAAVRAEQPDECDGPEPEDWDAIIDETLTDVLDERATDLMLNLRSLEHRLPGKVQ